MELPRGGGSDQRNRARDTPDAVQQQRQIVGNRRIDDYKRRCLITQAGHGPGRGLSTGDLGVGCDAAADASGEFVREVHMFGPLSAVSRSHNYPILPARIGLELRPGI